MDRLINQSIKESNPVVIIYQSRDSSFSKRTILVKSKNETYIKAYCYWKKQMRIFKIDSILAVFPFKKEERYYA